MPRSAVILFAHGAREPAWALPFRRLLRRLRVGGKAVELAFLEFMSPSLAEAAARLARGGFARITVVPLFLAQGRHLKRELPEMIEALRARHAGIKFRVTTALGDAPEVQAAIAAWIQRESDSGKAAPAGRRARRKK